MHEKRGKILGTILFILLISWLLYLSFLPDKTVNKGEVQMIEITGNRLLSENEYLTFTRLNSSNTLEHITLPVIKDRLDKHPYVAKSDVELNGNNRVTVTLREKNIIAVILGKSEPYFITDRFQIIPILSSTRFAELPVITNAPGSEEIVPLAVLNSEAVVQAFRVIEAARVTNENIHKKLAEINLRNGGDIVLTFSGVKPPVIFGKNEEAKKLVYLDIMWEGINGASQLSDESDYIDLRFADEIYVGNAVNTGYSE